MQKTTERIALLFATVLTFGAMFLPRSWEHPFGDICHVALILALGTIAILWCTQFSGAAGIAVERLTAALFLIAMPLVYVIAWFQAKGGGGDHFWLRVEVAGFPLFSALGVLGLRRNAWFLVFGIAAHGVAWDAWHYFTAAAYIPRWYATGCLLADIGLSVYIAARIPAWQTVRASRSSQGK